MPLIISIKEHLNHDFKYLLMTHFSFEFIDQVNLQLSDNLMNLHFSYSYSNKLFEYIQIVFWNLNTICMPIFLIFRKWILFILIFVSKSLFAPTLGITCHFLELVSMLLNVEHWYNSRMHHSESHIILNL